MNLLRTSPRLLVSIPAAALLALPAAALAQAPSPAPAPPAVPAAAPPADAEPLPSFDEIWAKALEATGGQAAIDAMQFVTTKGFMEMPAAGIKGPMSMQMKLPDQSVTTIEIAGIGKIQQGTNGEVGWSMDPMRGPSLTEPKEMAQQKAMQDLSRGNIDPRKVFNEITVVGRRDFAGRPCYEVLYKNADFSYTSFYDAETFLSAGMRMTMASPMGDLPMELVLSEYKAFDLGEGRSYKTPTRTTTKVMGQEQVVVIEEMTFAPIDPTVFEVPEAIKALVAQREQAKDAANAPADATAPSAPTAPANGNAPNARRPRPRPKQDAPATAPTP